MIRKASAEDLDTLVRLINDAFAVERFFKEGDRTDVDDVRSLMNSGTFLLYEDDHGVSGCVYVKTNGSRGYLGLLSVDPARQGTGLGRRLTEAAEKWCADSGCTAIDIRVVNLREELPPFYRKLGYVVTGEEPFPDVSVKIPCHFIKMSKELG